MVKKFYLFSLNDNRKQEVQEIKNRLNRINVGEVTEDEIFEMLLEKDRRFKLPDIDAKRVILKRRGIII